MVRTAGFLVAPLRLCVAGGQDRALKIPPVAGFSEGDSLQGKVKLVFGALPCSLAPPENSHRLFSFRSALFLSLGGQRKKERTILYIYMSQFLVLCRQKYRLSIRLP